MKILDETFFKYTCSICQDVCETDKSVYVLELDQKYPLCEDCFNIVKILNSKRSEHEIKKIFGKENVSEKPKLSKYHPKHFAISNLTCQTTNKIIKCDCCDQTVVEREKDLNLDELEKAKKDQQNRKDLKLYFKNLNIKVNLCDDCWQIVKTLKKISKDNDKKFLNLIGSIFKYKPRKINK